MNKKLVAFLLSTGILVSTCGTVFANEVTLDQPVETVNTPAPPINNTVNEVRQPQQNIEAPVINNTGNDVGETTVHENTKPIPEEPKAEKPKVETPKADETVEEVNTPEVNEMAETLKALCKNLDNNNMKVELRKNALECKEALEKLTKSIKTTSQSDNNKKMNAIKDEYTEKKNNIYDKYTKQYKEILNKLSENVKNGTVMPEEVKECYVILDKYERQMKVDKDIADKELDNLFKEYETIMDKAYEGMNKATSTVSESGSKMGSSSSGSSTSYSSTGTENPKTGDYTTLGASIATMIAGIAGIFVSRKR